MSNQIINFLKTNRPLMGISLGHAVAHWYPVSFFIVLPYIQQSLDLSYTEVGIIISVQYFASSLSNIPGGMIVDIVGKRKLLMVLALTWVGLPYFFMGIFSNYVAVLFCAGLVGIGNNLWHPAALSELTNLYADRKGWAIGIHSTAANLGDAIAPIFVGFLLLGLVWEKVVMINVLPGLIMALVIWLILRDSSSNVAANSGAGKKEKDGLTLKEYLKGLLDLIKSPELLLVVLVSGVRSFAQNSLRTFLPLYFVNVQLVSSFLAGIYFSIIEVSGAVAAPISGYFSDIKGRRIIVLIGLLGTAISVLFFSFTSGSWLIFFSLSALGFFLYSLRPVLFAWALEQVSDKYGGTTVGMMFGLQSFFSSLAPLLGGWIADTWGIKYTFYLIVGVLILCSLLTLLTKESSANNLHQEGKT